MFSTKRRTLHLLFVLLLVSERHCVEHRINWNLAGVEAVNRRVDVNLLDTVKLICSNNQSTVTYFYSSSDFIDCAINSSNILDIGHCGNPVIGGAVTLTIHGVTLPNAINYVENDSYNFTSLSSGECANGLWLTVRVVERLASSITPTSTITATLSTTTSSFTSTTSGTGATGNSMRDILVSAIKTTTSTNYATSTQSSTPTIGGANEENGSFISSLSLGVKIGSVAGIVIAVFGIVCLVCLVVVGLVLCHSKKRQKGFKTDSPSPKESIHPLIYEGIDSNKQSVALDGTKDKELTDNNIKTISSEENNSTKNLEIKNSAYGIMVTNGHSVSSPSRPPPKPPTNGPSRPPPHKPTNSVKEPTSLPASSKPLPASSKPTNTGPASLPHIRNSPKATATVTPSSVQYKSRRQAPAPPPSLNNKTKLPTNNALRSV